MKTRKGFTIAELSMSMAFIAFLLIAIATLIIYAISLYQKGLSLRAVNNTGLELIDELTRSISGSTNSKPDCNVLTGSNRSSCNSDNGYKLTYYQGSTSVYLAKATTPTTISAPSWGMFCTGTYSYVWNSGYLSTSDGTYKTSSSAANNSLHAYRASVNSNSNFRFLRMNDSSRAVCQGAISNGSYAAPGKTITVPDEVYNSRRELLSSASENKLALYDLRVYKPTYHTLTGHAFYSGSFVIGTVAGSVNIQTTSDVCKEAPDGLSTDFAYCAINKFNFSVRASGSK